MKRPEGSFVFTPDLGARLRELRLRAGLTQLELARAMGRAGKKAGNLVGRLERGDEPYPSFGLVADFLRGCRAGFKDITDTLDIYTDLPTVQQVVYGSILDQVIHDVPRRRRTQVTGYDRQLDRDTSTARPVPGRSLPDRLQRLERAKKNASAARRRFIYGQYLSQAVNETGLDPVLTITEPLFNHGLEWFRILYRTRKTSPRIREKLLAESEARFEQASRFPLAAIRKLEDGVRRQFRRLEMTKDLDWVPDVTLEEYEASLLAPGRKRSLKQADLAAYRQKYAAYDEARKAAVERVWTEAQPMLDDAGVPSERRPLYRRVINACCTAATNFEPGSVVEKQQLDERILDPDSIRLGLDTALAWKLAGIMLARFRELASSFPPDPRPRR